jgi:hypothetical protein
MSSRAINIACTRANASRDSALVMFFNVRLEKHLCNAMSHDLLLALAVVSFDHLITPTHSSDICSYLWSGSESCRTSFAVCFSPIPDDIVYFVIQPESKGSRTSFAGGFNPIHVDMRVCFDSRSDSEGSRISSAGGFRQISTRLELLLVSPHRNQRVPISCCHEGGVDARRRDGCTQVLQPTCID